MTAHAIDADALAALADDLAGEVVTPDDDEYEEARRVWNGMINKRPAAVAYCEGVGDVRTAVGVARDHELPLTVRGGGHGVAGNAVEDGGLVVDLSAMDAVRVDPDEQTVRVGGGAQWADVDRETQQFDLAVPGGVVSTPASRGSRSAAASATSGGSTAPLRTTSGPRTW